METESIKVETESIKMERDVHCPKCGYKLRKVKGNIDSHKNYGAVGTDLYCDNCKDVMMTVFD